MPGGGTWTTPKTWLAAILSVADMNTHVRDNLNALTQATSTITTTGTQTALSIPTGRGDLVLFANNASALTIQGIAAGQDGQLLRIYSIGAGDIILAHNSGSASAANKLLNQATSASSQIVAGTGCAAYRYDGTAARWRMEAFDQGNWLAAGFTAGDYTASAGNWTLASGDVTTCRYRLRGKTLEISLFVTTTTVSSTPATLMRAIPGGFTSTARMDAFTLGLNDNGGGWVSGFVGTSASGTTLNFTKASGNWSAATDTTALMWNGAIEVT